MSSAPPITKPPAERTFYTAVAVLCVLAAVQIVAAGLALVSRIDFDKWSRAMNSHSAAAAPAPEVDDEAARVSEAQALLDEGNKFRAAGSAQNFQGALEAVKEADRLIPNKAPILYQMASDYSMLGKNAEAAGVLQRVIALPPSGDPQEAGLRSKAKEILAQLSTAGVKPAAPLADASAPAKASAESRDDVGIPIGSVMGLVDVKLVDGDPGQKNLRVSMKGASSQKIDPTKVHATVDFYEQDDHAQIMHNDVPRPSEWLSAPVDWADGDPEIFQVKYRLPLEDRGDIPPLQYYGYVVAIYYDGELQDQRADPPSLLNQYAPPLHKDPPAE